MAEKLDEKAMGFALGIVSAVSMLVLGILGNIGIYTGAVQMMTQWHMFFSLSPVGIISGVVEAAIISFVLGYAFGWVYNRFI